MSLSAVPASVRQAVENMNDKANPRHIRENYKMTLENIQRYCEISLDAYNKDRNFRRR